MSFIDIYETGTQIPIEAKALYSYLKIFANSEGVCWPSRDKMARDLGIGVHRLDKCMKVLIENGIVEKTRTASGNIKNRNTYKVHDCIRNIDHRLDESGLDESGLDESNHSNNISINNTNINNTSINNNSNNINTPSNDSSTKDDNNNIFNTTSTTTVRRENNQGDEERKFTPPTLAELMEYKDYYPKVNLYKFFEHYEGNGWIKKDGSPVDSLKALKTLLTQCNIGNRDYM
nr:MAG TPA: helix-turn-helix domain protein [Caudoviricetes sp.]